MKISVAMATYNGEKFILNQLESILNQALKPDEVIICDDFSTDSTVEIVKNFINKYSLTSWQIYVNEKNVGYIKNFAKALSYTNGDLIFLCDQDDLWHNDKISVMSKIMEENRNVKALASSYKLIDAEGNEIIGQFEKFYTPKSGKELEKVKYKNALYYNVAQGCAEVIRSDLKKAYCENLKAFTLPHDWAINMLAFEQDGLYFLNKELFSYRIHSNNTTGVADSDSAVTERIPRLKKYTAFMRDALNLPLSEKQKREYSRISEFTKVRTEFLESKKLSAFFGGIQKYFFVFIRYFPLTYLKDLFLVLSGKL